jgi:hypothetical protein
MTPHFERVRNQILTPLLERKQQLAVLSAIYRDKMPPDEVKMTRELSEWLTNAIIYLRDINVDTWEDWSKSMVTYNKMLDGIRMIQLKSEIFNTENHN